jgi:hypothetical protein
MGEMQLRTDSKINRTRISVWGSSSVKRAFPKPYFACLFALA